MSNPTDILNQLCFNDPINFPHCQKAIIKLLQILAELQILCNILKGIEDNLNALGQRIRDLLAEIAELETLINDKKRLLIDYDRRLEELLSTVRLVGIFRRIRNVLALITALTFAILFAFCWSLGPISWIACLFFALGWALIPAAATGVVHVIGDEIESGLKTINEQIADLRRRIKELEDEIIELENKLADLKSKLQDLESQEGELSHAEDDIEGQIDNKLEEYHEAKDDVEAKCSQACLNSIPTIIALPPCAAIRDLLP